MLKTNCPICDAQVTLPEKTEESEIISCPDCHTRLVVAESRGNTVHPWRSSKSGRRLGRIKIHYDYDRTSTHNNTRR